MVKNILKKLFIVCLIILTPTFVFVACDKDNTDGGSETGTENSTITTPGGNEGDSTETTPVNYDILYILNGGENHSDNPTSFTSDTETITLKAPTRIGYEFLGWYTDGNAWDAMNPDKNKVETITGDTKKDLILNAKWRGLWYIDPTTKETTLTDYAKKLLAVDIVPDINDSLGCYSSKSFSFVPTIKYGYQDFRFHEGVEEVSLSEQSNYYVASVYLPSTIKSYLTPSVDGKAKFCDTIYISNIETWLNIKTIQPYALYNTHFVYWDNKHYINLELTKDLLQSVNDTRFYGAKIGELIIPDDVTEFNLDYFNGFVCKSLYVGQEIVKWDEFCNLSITGSSSGPHSSYYYLNCASEEVLRVLLDTETYIDMECALHIRGVETTTITIGEETKEDNILNLKLIKNIIVEDGVETLPKLPRYTGYIVLPTSVTSFSYNYQGFPVSETLLADYPYPAIYFKGAKSDWKLTSELYDIMKEACYYYSESEPTIAGKYWKYGEDGKTPVSWSELYTTLKKGEEEFVVYNGTSRFFMYFDNPKKGTYDLLVKDEHGLWVTIATYTFSTGYSYDYKTFVKLKANVSGFTNENGEWIYRVNGRENILEFASIFTPDTSS